MEIKAAAGMGGTSESVGWRESLERVDCVGDCRCTVGEDRGVTQCASQHECVGELAAARPTLSNLHAFTFLLHHHPAVESQLKTTFMFHNAASQYRTIKQRLL